MVWKRVWTMPVGMNKCVFRTERRTFESSIITKWTFFLTREGKIKKGLQGWNYRQGELQERLRGTSTRPARKWRARPAWEHRKARSENDDCPARGPKPYPIPVPKAIEDRSHVSCDQAILLLSCEQWFLQDGHSVRPGETTARRVSFFPFVLKKEKKTPDRRLRGTQRNLSKNCIHGISLWERAQESEKNLSGNSLPRPQEPFVVKIIHKRDQSVSRVLNASGLAVAIATSVNVFITFPGAVFYVFCRN